MEDYPKALLEMERRFSTEEACRAYLEQLRWPQGWVCWRCGGGDSWRASRGRWVCATCGYQSTVTAGTIFARTRTPLPLWFRAIWWVTSQKNGASALGLQRILGLGSYETAWTWLHKLRRAMVRPGRDRLGGCVEVDETYIGGREEGVVGRLTHAKALVIVAVQEDGKGTGRIRLARIPVLNHATAHGFIAQAIQPSSVVRTDGLRVYQNLKGYTHERIVVQRRAEDASALLPRVHRVISLLKRWLMGTHQGAVSHAHLEYYLDEFTFRFNRRKSRSRGKLFYRLLQQAVAIGPAPYDHIIKHVRGRASGKHKG
jgi:transposase-like protein